jgi:hypothetical protein
MNSNSKEFQDAIYGTSRYGSGYTYGSDGYWVDSLPFPYVFWPVPVHHYYYGCDEVRV